LDSACTLGHGGDRSSASRSRTAQTTMSAVRPMVTRWAGRPEAPCSAPGAFGTAFRDTVYRLESGKPTLATMRTTTQPCHHVGHMRCTTHSALTYIKPTVTPAFALRLRAVGFRSRLRSHARASAQARAPCDDVGLPRRSALSRHVPMTHPELTRSPSHPLGRLPCCMHRATGPRAKQDAGPRPVCPRCSHSVCFACFLCLSPPPPFSPGPHPHLPSLSLARSPARSLVCSLPPSPALVHACPPTLHNLTQFGISLILLIHGPHLTIWTAGAGYP
jgi:hypothetical protein